MPLYQWLLPILQAEKDAFLRRKIAELELIAGGSAEQMRQVSSAISEAKSALNQKKIERDDVITDKIACQDNLQAVQKKHE